MNNGDGSRAPGEHLIENVYTTYSPLVLRFLLAKGLEREAAEDLTQEVFFRLLRSGKELHDDEYLRNLIFRIANNLAIDHFRKNNGSVQERVTQDGFVGKDHPDLVAPVSPEDVVISSETRSDVMSVLSRLPHRHSQAIVLRELQGLSYREMASRMGISEKAAESLLHRARVHLKSGLAEAGERRGGWWSGIGLALRGIPGRVGRVLRQAAGRAAGVVAGAGGLGGMGSLANFALVFFLIGSVVCAGAACAYGTRGSRVQAPGAYGGSPTSTVQPAAEEAAAENGPTAGSVSGKALASPETGAVEGALERAEGITVRLLGATGDVADRLLGDVGGLLQTVTTPLLDLLAAAGVPPGVVRALNDLCGLQAARSLTGDLLSRLSETGCAVDKVAGSLVDSVQVPQSPTVAGPAANGQTRPQGPQQSPTQVNQQPAVVSAPTPPAPTEVDEGAAPASPPAEQQTNLIQDVFDLLTKDILHLK